MTRNRTNRTKQDKKNCNVSRETQTFLLKKLTTRAERVLRDIKNVLQITRCSHKTPVLQGAPSTVWREVPCNGAASSERCSARINRRTTAAVMKKRKKNDRTVVPQKDVLGLVNEELSPTERSVGRESTRVLFQSIKLTINNKFHVKQFFRRSGFT